jgi:hypothetical protein
MLRSHSKPDRNLRKELTETSGRIHEALTKTLAAFQINICESFNASIHRTIQASVCRHGCYGPGLWSLGLAGLCFPTTSSNYCSSIDRHTNNSTQRGRMGHLEVNVGMGHLEEG